MTYAAIDENNRLHCLPTAPDDVKAYAKMLTGEEAYALAATRTLRCGLSGCSATLFYRQGPCITPNFFHEGGAGGTCPELTGLAGEWHLRMQYEVFKHSFAREWRMQGAIADVVVERQNPSKRTGVRNKFAIEVQHSPISRQDVLDRHAAHQAAGLVGTIWIIDGRELKRGLRLHTTWMIDLLKACAETPGDYPCTVLVYKDKRGEEGGTETVSVIEAVEFGTEANGARYAHTRLLKKKGAVVRFSMEALSFLAEGPSRPNVVPISLGSFQPQLDSLPTRRVGKFSSDTARIA